MSKLVFSLGLALLITACATTKPPAQTPAATASGGQSNMQVLRGTKPTADKNMICSRSYPMDSHIPELICVTPEQAAARKKAAQQEMNNLQNGPSSGPPGL